LDTDVGEEGKALSGGQQQKVAILRGLLKKAPIRLLDEITAPFDSQSASHMLESMQETSEGITTLMVTHKLTEAQSVDQIIVLDKGRVMAQGQHHDLLKTCPLYQKLWNAYTTQDDASSVAPLAESVVPHVPHMSIAQRTPYRQSELGFFSEPEKTCQVSNIEASHLKMN
jgi:ABC-type multidrug transport system ATPase subunit